MQWPSFSLILSEVFLAYIVYSIYTLSLLFVPPACEEGKPCLTSYLSEKPQLELHIYTSVRRQPLERDLNLIYLDDNFNYYEPNDLTLLLNIPQRTQQNGTLFMHLILVPETNKHERTIRDLQKNPLMVYATIKLTQYAVPKAQTFNLLGDADSKPGSAKKYPLVRPVSHLKPKVAFTIMTDDVKLPTQNVPAELVNHLRIIHGRIFLPIMNHDFLQSRHSDLVEISHQNSTVNLTLSYNPTTFSKLILILQTKNAMETLMYLGFSDKDIDEVKGIFADTNIYLLGGTFLIAAVHVLFDFLAFKNDVSFWRRKDNLVGMSKWTIMWRCFSQTVIFLYLLDEGTSLLVLIPGAIGCIIEVWKLRKVLRLGVKEGSNSDAEVKTREFDTESMVYLSYLLYPLVIGGAIYSLLYEPHKSWYSWSIHSLAKGVYAFGFLFMLPQLFVNYKLKSVAHLPWRTFMYKAFNTFIDDIFAFIITMPTAHRIACFRDDAVFLVYLYQRWLYPVDKSRVNLDTSIEETVDFAHSDKKKN